MLSVCTNIAHWKFQLGQPDPTDAVFQTRAIYRIDTGIVKTHFTTLETPHLYWGQRDWTVKIREIT